MQHMFCYLCSIQVTHPKHDTGVIALYTLDFISVSATIIPLMSYVLLLLLLLLLLSLSSSSLLSL
jgi:hypothetical protein